MLGLPTLLTKKIRALSDIDPIGNDSKGKRKNKKYLIKELLAAPVAVVELLLWYLQDGSTSLPH